MNLRSCRGRPILLSAFTALLSWAGPAWAGSWSVVGDEGLEPNERRVEAGLGSESLSVTWRRGYVRRTGVSTVLTAQSRWQGGYTAVGAGGSYRVFGGYPLRLVVRASVELGLGPVHGPSLGATFVPGVAAEVGREGRVTAAVGAAAPLSFYVLPETAALRGLAFDGVVSAPVRDKWRVGVGLRIGQQGMTSGEPFSVYDVDAIIGIARWL